MGKECPKCGHELDDGLLFCVKCGVKLQKTCSKCGVVLADSDMFCFSCGEPVSNPGLGANDDGVNQVFASPVSNQPAPEGKEKRLALYRTVAVVAVLAVGVFIVLPYFLLHNSGQGGESTGVIRRAKTVPDSVKVTFPLYSHELYGQIIESDVDMFNLSYTHSDVVKYIFQGGEYVVIQDIINTRPGDEYPWYIVRYYNKHGRVYGKFLHIFPKESQSPPADNAQPLPAVQMRPLVPDSVKARMPLVAFSVGSYGQIRESNVELKGAYKKNGRYYADESKVYRVLERGEYVIVTYELGTEVASGSEWRLIQCEDGTCGAVDTRFLRVFDKYNP